MIKKNRLIDCLNMFFTVMQVGFACLEAGCVQPKNVVNILLKNVLDLCK